jgi:hypothetical protein
METIAALELVVGFPVIATVSAARRGTLRIETQGTAYGLNLETGERIPAEPAATHEPQLLQPHVAFGFVTGAELGYEDEAGRRFTTWSPRGEPPRLLAVQLGAIMLGNDDRVITCSSRAIHLLDRTDASSRSIAVPPPLGLRDRVTGGLQGDMNRTPLYVEPGFIVFVRSPALLVVARADVERALVFDRVRWGIETRLAIREPELAVPAHRGKWHRNTVVTSHGALEVAVAAEPVQVRDRLWPPNGWAQIDLADGTTVAAFKPPIEHRVLEVNVAISDLFVAIPNATTWPEYNAPAPPEPPAGFADLALAPPRPTFAAALAYAKDVRLAERTGAYGPLTDALDQLAGLVSKEFGVREDTISDWIYGALCHQGGLYAGTAYAVPALVAIAADPETLHRHALASALVAIAQTAHRSNNAAVLHAFRRCLQMLLNLERATRKHATSWSALVYLVALAEGLPEWWRDASRRCPDLAALDVPGAFERLMRGDEGDPDFDDDEEDDDEEDDDDDQSIPIT